LFRAAAQFLRGKPASVENVAAAVAPEALPERVIGGTPGPGRRATTGASKRCSAAPRIPPSDSSRRRPSLRAPSKAFRRATWVERSGGIGGKPAS